VIDGVGVNGAGWLARFGSHYRCGGTSGSSMGAEFQRELMQLFSVIRCG